MARRTPRQRRCRAIVVWTVGAFVLIQLALGMAVDALLPQVRDPEFVHREQLLREQMARAPRKPLVLMIGSSRVLNGFDAETAAQTLNNEAIVFNFGIPSSGPFLEEIWLERLQAAGAKPDVLLIEVLPAFFNGRRLPYDQTSLDGARLKASELDRLQPSLGTLANPIRRWTVGRLLPSYRHQTELRSLLRIDEPRNGPELPEDLRTVDAQGWQPRSYPPERHRALAGLAHRQYDDCYRDFHLSREQVEHLEHMLAYCKKESIRAVLVLMPEGSEFRRLYTPEMTAAIDGLLERFHEKYGVSIINARAWIDDMHFYDMHHLMYWGARAFSARCAHEGIAPLLREQGSEIQVQPQDFDSDAGTICNR